MTLSAGEKLGPYEVLGRIGAGGMGEVYRARDTRLGRHVAIKILPEEVSADRDRVRRFETEMKAVGRLSHPNVLAVYDTGEREGVPYLVTELLEGETLRDRLDRGAIPQEDLLPIAIEIASGLAAAHAAGVVHRDLKPENVFLTKDGRTKLLDFGLAKLLAPPMSIDMSAAPEAETVSRATATGLVVGTVSYMSPEQVRGEAVDHRSDLFAFGTVLFEMASGEVAFRRKSAFETMTATVSEDPFGRLSGPSPLPAGLERVVRRCLEKDPDARYQSAADLTFHLRELGGFGSVASADRLRFEAAGRTPVWTRGRIAAALGAALVVLAGAFFVVRAATAPAPLPDYRQLTFRRGAVLSARYTPDGRTVVFGASWDGEPFRLFSMRTESPESRPLDIPPADVLAVSSKGELAISIGRRFVYGFSTRGTLARAPMNGGAPREILGDVEDADFSPDGKELAVSHVVDGRYRLEYPIGRVLHRAEGWISHVRVSPDGDRVAFIDHPVLGDDRGSICVVDRNGKVDVLSSGWASASGLAWSPSGNEVWFTATEVSPNCALWAVTLSGKTRLLARSAGRLCVQDVRADGEALVTEGRARIGMALGRHGAPVERDLSWLDASVVSDLSADGRQILFGEQGAGGGAGVYAVYTRASDGSPAVRLGEGTAGPLSPDGKWAVSILSTTPPALQLLPTGPGQARTLDRGTLSSYQSVAWYPDGKRLLIAGNEAKQPVRLFVQSVESGPPRAVSPAGMRIVPSSDAVSPDGTRAAVLDAADRVVLFPLGEGVPIPASGVEPGDVPVRWSADGGSLFVVRFDGLPFRIRRVDLATGRREVVAEAAPPDPAGIEMIVSAQVTPDGATYAYSFFQYKTDLHLLTGLR